MTVDHYQTYFLENEVLSLQRFEVSLVPVGPHPLI